MRGLLSNGADLGARLSERLTGTQRRALIAAGVVMVLLVAAFFLLVPSLAEGRARAKLLSHGYDFEVASVSAGLSSIRFDQATVRSKASGRVVAKIDHIDADFSLLRRALTGVEVGGAVLDLAVDDLAAQLSRRAQARAAASPAPAASSGGGSGFPVRLLDSLVLLRDRHGPLLQAEKVNVHVADGVIHAEARDVALGDRTGESIRLSEVSVEALRAQGRVKLRKASLKGADLRWRSASIQQSDATLTARLRALRKKFRPPGHASAPATPSPEPAQPVWTDDLAISLEGARVVDLGVDGKQKPLLERLSLKVAANGPSALKLTGQGAAPGGGSISWDARVVPSELRGEGRFSLKEVPLALFAPVMPPLPFYELDQTRIGADLTLSGHGLESADVKGSLEIRDLAFFSEGLSREPVGPLSLTADGQATWVPARRELSNLHGTANIGRTSVSASGALSWPEDGYRVDLELSLPETRCADALSAVPTGLLDDLSTIQMRGVIAAKLTAHVDAADLPATKLDFDIKDRCKFVEVPELLSLAYFEQPFLHQVLEPDDTIYEFETGPGTAAWTPIEEISPFMLQAVIAHEDGRFPNHHGFAEPEIGAALARNLQARAFKFGASTITMQLVKNVFLHREKLLSRKVQEALIVWWLEQNWDKRKILELYLNVIEYGPAIYGIRMAAHHYFGTTPAKLSPAQAGFLAMILPSPKTSHSYYEKGKLSESMKRRIARFLQHMHSRERIDDEALASGLEELESFRFYDPQKPPPLPPEVRGTAQLLPFMGGQIVDPWETLDYKSFFEEDGNY